MAEELINFDVAGADRKETPAANDTLLGVDYVTGGLIQIPASQFAAAGQFLTDRSTTWKPLIFLNTWQDRFAGYISQYRINEIGNLEVAVMAKTSGNSYSSYMFQFQPEDQDMIFATFRDEFQQVINIVADGLTGSPQFYKRTSAGMILDFAQKQAVVGGTSLDWSAGIPATGYYLISAQMTFFKK